MIRPEMGIVQLLTDPDEGRFLQALLGPADRRTWLARTGHDVLHALGLRAPNDHRYPLLAYADYLRDRDAVRAEFLRLEYQLAGTDHPAEIGPEQQARYRELLDQLGHWELWLRAVKRNDRLLNCGQALALPLAVRFRYQCPNQWETLAPTQERAVRYCGECRRNVYLCDTVEAAERHARQGNCIAVPLAVTNEVRNEVIPCMTGMPDVHQLWGEELFGR